MHKPLKGAIALAAAGGLLLGGAGTYALWNDSVDLSGGTINSGQLEFVDTTPGVWRDVSDGSPGTVITNISTFVIVPGDVLTYSLSTTLNAQGDNLEATIAADPSTITGDADLLADLDITTAVSTGGTEITGPITEANHEDVIDVLVTLTFDETGDNDSQTDEIDLSEFTLTVTQNQR
jgi:alternate signal-mediated exported protein